ncbi:MAG: hypothetical protein C7B46_16150 [Sulfobacillus benefaciens]|jgi:hypothetical protein|uniref:SCP2 domain-containing protein n=1 Tax=Sulfobacillus benefaciens TaxID=453960 RepID=A0A2T2XC56_9FIRM|nr:MAG: hypothetical protein C7B46_16150 [Sulfobacillus benefaciens]
MPIFSTTEALETVLGGFFERLRFVEQAYLIYQIGGTMEFVFRKPDARIRWIPQPEEAVAPFAVEYGEATAPVLLTFEQDGDTAHRFWLGRINLQQALARQQVIARGPLSRAMKLIPHLDEIYPLYADYLHEIGHDEWIGSVRP